MLKYTFLFASLLLSLSAAAANSAPHEGHRLDEYPGLYSPAPPLEELPPGHKTTGDTPFAHDPLATDGRIGRAAINEVPGESIDTRTGALSLSMTDLVLPGDGGLDIVVSRTRAHGSYRLPIHDYVAERQTQDTIADWRLDIPYVQFASVEAFHVLDPNANVHSYWHTPLYYNTGHTVPSADPSACAAPFSAHPEPQEGLNPPYRFDLPYTVVGTVANSYNRMHQGFIVGGLPGGADQQLMLRTLGVYQNTAEWKASCEPSAHGFNDQHLAQWVVRAPNGLTYYFDEPTRGLQWPEAFRPGPGAQGYPKYYGHMRMYVSTIKDQHGNALHFEYDSSLVKDGIAVDLREFAYIKRIYGDDGRAVQFEWECNPFALVQPAVSSSKCPANPAGRAAAPPYRLKSFSSGGRTWQFEYNDDDTTVENRRSRLLKSVELPNGQKWQYLATDSTSEELGYTIGDVRTIDYQVTYPSGGIVKYLMRPREFVHNTDDENDKTIWYGAAVASRSVDDRINTPTITNWCYGTYSRTNKDPVWTHVVRHLGAGTYRLDAYEFYREGGDEAWREGLLKQHLVYATSQPGCASPANEPANLGAYLQKTEPTYKAGRDLAPIFEQEQGTGASALAIDENAHRPRYSEALRKQRLTTRRVTDDKDAGTYEWRAAAFTREGLPQLTSVSSALSVSPPVSETDVPATDDHWRASRTEYYTPPGNVHVVGLIARQCPLLTPDHSTCPADEGGTYEYYAETAKLKKVTSYGKASETGYDDKGNIAWQQDAIGRTSYTNFKRGMPQLITYADNATETLVVNDDGTIASTTDAAGVTTTYVYDDLGRLDDATFETGEPLDIEWAQDGRSRTATRGTLTTTSRYDGLGRLIEESSTDKRELALASDDETIVSTLGFDAAGRKVFESLPSATLAETQNEENRVRFGYDVLDRLIGTSQWRVAGASSVKQLVTSTIEYMPGLRRRSFDPAGNVTEQTFESFGAPGYDALVSASVSANVSSPAISTMSLVRDRLGFVETATQDSVTRTYKANDRRDLAFEYVPELGPKTIDGLWNVSYCRDLAGNITGKSLRARCNTEDGRDADLVQIKYDQRGRVKQLIYNEPNTSGVLYAYTASGKTDTITKGQTFYDVDYDASDLPSRERLEADNDYAFQIVYGRDTLNNIDTMQYPSGYTYAFAPDARGRPRKALPFVTNVTYHVRGPVHEITFANGQKTRFDLHQVGTDISTIRTGPADGALGELVYLDYSYDVNGNVGQMMDVNAAGKTQEFGYDALNRLNRTSFLLGSNSWDNYARGYYNTGNVQFDEARDRARLPAVGGRGRMDYTYDSVTNRLKRITIGGVSRPDLTYDKFGNMTWDGERVFEFGADGNLLNAHTTAGANKQFEYDGRNQMVKELGGPDGPKYFFYTGNKLLFEYEPEAHRYTEYVYIGSMLVGSRNVERSDREDSDGDGIVDDDEFRNQPGVN